MTLPSGPSSMPNSSPATGIPQPRLLYYVQRDNGTLAPLIPADEMPFDVRLQGVPRILSVEQVWAMGMQCVGFCPYTSLIFRSEGTALSQRTAQSPPSRSTSTEGRNFLAPDAFVRQASNPAPSATAAAATMPQRPVPASAESLVWRRAATPASPPNPGRSAAADAQARIDTIIASNSGPSRQPPQPSAAAEQDGKEFCTYWIRHGECDYIQQGCRYKHNMPGLDTLRKIGFRTVPLWWRERTAPRLADASASGFGTVGEPTKPAVWLAQKTGESDDEDSGSEADGPQGPNREVRCTGEANRSQAPGDKALETKTPPRIASPDPSVVDDLIELMPLIPTPSSSSASLTPASSADSSPRHPPTSPTTPPPGTVPSLAPPISASHSTYSAQSAVSRVFVPAGGDPKFHIAEARRHARRRLAQSPRAPVAHRAAAPPSHKPIAPGTAKQMQDLRYSPHHNGRGMMASRHAPRMATTAAAAQITAQKPRASDVCCRLRRRPAERFRANEGEPQPDELLRAISLTAREGSRGVERTQEKRVGSK